MKNMHKPSNSNKLWESRKLGATEEFVRAISLEKTKEIQDNLGLQPITVRLQKELVERLKVLARQEGLGYQPFVRQILTKYVREAGKKSD